MRPSITAGVCVGLTTGAWMFTEYALGFHDDPAGAGRWTGFLSLMFPFFGAYWTVVKSRLSTWIKALREGLIFGALGGLLGGAATYIYFTVVNPGFTAGGPVVDAATQAIAGFAGSLILGPILIVIMYAVLGRRRRNNG